MHNLICTTAAQSLGNTFLDWSLHFLYGCNTYLYIDEKFNYNRNHVVDNPLMFQQEDVGNAHKHKKTVSHGSEHTQSIIDKAKSVKLKNEIVSIYAVPLPAHKAANIFYTQSIISDIFHDANTTNQLIKKTQQDYCKIFEVCNQNSIPLVFVNDTMWNCDYKPRYTTIWDNSGNQCQSFSYIDNVLHSLDWSFRNSKESFGHNIWDIREYIAIHYRPYRTKNHAIDFSLPHYYVEANSLWTDGEHCISYIMDWLNLKIQSKKFNIWLPVYKQWQNMQIARLRLPQNINYICNAIINGYSHDLKQYKLDLFDEAYIQHMLIYKHGLTLKNWNLEKFPMDTRELTPLLEESFYEGLEKLY